MNKLYHYFSQIASPDPVFSLYSHYFTAKTYNSVDEEVNITNYTWTTDAGEITQDGLFTDKVYELSGRFFQRKFIKILNYV